MTNYTIALITGGPTLEADGTAASTEALCDYFEQSDHRVSVVNLGQTADPVDLLRGCDVAFNAIHGRGGEDGAVHYLAELAQIPVTGAVWWAHSLGADKLVFKDWATNLVRVPRSAIAAEDYPHGLIKKPRFGGGSIGLERLDSFEPVDDPNTIVEEFLPGRIVTSCVFPALGRDLPLLEIGPNESGLYDEAAKRGRTESSYVPIRPGEADWARSINESSSLLYEHLGRRGPVRFDWIVEQSTSDPVLLEINTNPGWRPLGNMGRIVSAAGFSQGQLIETVLSEALDLHAYSV